MFLVVNRHIDFYSTKGFSCIFKTDKAKFILLICITLLSVAFEFEPSCTYTYICRYPAPGRTEGRKSERNSRPFFASFAWASFRHRHRHLHHVCSDVRSSMKSSTLALGFRPVAYITSRPVFARYERLPVFCALCRSGSC